MNNSMRCTVVLLVSLMFAVVGNIESQTVFEESGLATGQPGMNRYPEANPGETMPMERAYDIAPPVIPHTIKNFTITRSTNMCFVCHSQGIKFAEGHIATKIPSSHYVNDYNQKQENDRVTGIRYNCLQCHVLQADVALPERTPSNQ